MADPILVWDLDKTLGFFEPLYKHWNPDLPVTLQFRPGIIETLRRLKEQGYTHRLLTLASTRAADVILEAAGIRDLFFAIEGIGDRGKGDVEGIGAEHSLSKNEWPHQMLFIGDHPFNDCPRDLRVVFHLEINALERPALQLELLISELMTRGNGSFIRGYRAIARDCSWLRFWNWPVFQGNQPMLRTVPGIDPLALMTGAKINPILAFEKEPIEKATPDLLTFTPSQLRLPERPES